MAQTQLETLYNSLKRNNYDVPPTFERFARTLTAPGMEGVRNRQTLYRSLRDSNFDVPDTYERFSRTLFAPARPKGRKSPKPGARPAPAPRGSFMRSIQGMTERFNRRMRAVKEVFTPLEQSLKNLQLKPDAAARASREDPVETELAQARAERERLSEAMRRRGARLDERRDRRGFLPQDPGLNVPQWASDRAGDSEYSRLSAARNANERRIRLLEAKRDKAGFWRGFLDAARNPDTWMLGLSSLKDTLTTGQVKGKIERRGNKSLTSAERAMLGNKERERLAESKYGDDLGWLYRAGDITASALPFVGEFIATGGFSGIASAGSRMGARAAAKYATGKIGRWVLKSTGTMAGDLAAGLAMANTTGAMRTAAGILSRRQGSVTSGHNGDYSFEGGKSLLRSIYEGEMASTLEYYTEMLGAHMGAAGAAGRKWLRKGMERIGAGRVSDTLSRITGSEWAKTAGSLLRRGGVHDYPAEVMEEEANILLNSILVGDNSLSDLADRRTQADIFGGMMLSIGFMQSPGLAGGARQAAKYLRYRHKTGVSDKEAAIRIGEERWQPIRERIDLTPNGSMADVIDGIVKDEGLTRQGKEAALGYIGNLMRTRGCNLRAAAEAKDRISQAGENRNAPGDGGAESAGGSYMEGYSLADPDGRRDAATGMRQRREALAGTVPEELLEAIDGDPDAATETIRGNAQLDDAQKQKALDYVSARSAYNGMLQRINDDADYMAAQRREQAKQMQHSDGKIRPATLKEQDEEGHDKQVYVVDGNVAMTADGTMVDAAKSDKSVVVYDPATGERRMIDPAADTGVMSMGEAKTAEEYDAGIERGREEYIQRQVDEAQGKVALEPGQRLVLPTGEDAVVMATGGDDVTVALAGGKQASVSLAELQRIADEKALAGYRQRHGIADEPGAAPGRQAETPAEEPARDGGIVAGAPADYTPDMELTIRDEDGTEKPAMVMGRVRYDGGQFVPDNNGNIIEYYMDGEVRHDREDRLLDKVVSHLPAQSEPEQGNNATENIPQQETPATVEPQQPATVEQPVEAAQATEQPQQPATTEQPTAEPMPMKEDGEEDYYATTPERAHSYIFNETGLSRSDATAHVMAQKDAADKALLKAKSAKMPTMGTSIMKFNEAKARRQEKIDEAQRQVDYWNRVREIQDGITQQEAAERAAANAVAHDEAVAQAQADFEARKAAEAERKAVGNENPMPAITEKWDTANKVDGHRDEIMLPNGEPLKGHYVLHESGASSPSHNSETWAKTDGFPMDANDNSVNDRDYERDRDAQRHTEGIAQQYDQRALQNVPVVSSDGVVLSGNGRTMAGEIAARNNTDGAYVDYLKEYAHKFGFTPEQVEGMQHPRVSFVPDDAMPYTAETFAKFNQQEMKSQNKTEQAVKLGKTVSGDTFKNIVRTINGYDTLGDFYNDPQASLGAVYGLHGAGVIPQAQMAEMVDGVRGQERLSAVGREFLENMLIGKAFDNNPEVVRMLTAVPSMRQTVITALGEISDNIALGEDWSLQYGLADAVKLVFNARNDGGYQHGDIVSVYARQGKLFADPDELQTVADFNNATMLMLADVLNDKRVTLLKTTLQLYNNNARQSAAGQTDLFAGGIQSREDILRDVINYFRHANKGEYEQRLTEAVERRKAESVQQDGTPPAGSGGSEATGRNTGGIEARDNDGRGNDGSLAGRQPGSLEEANNLTYRLSDEVDENGQQFVLNSNGDIAFGFIREETGLTPAPILLSEGVITNPQTGAGYGLLHIEARHGKQIRDAGYASVLEFIEEVAENYNTIRKGNERNGLQTYMLQLTDKHNNTLLVELSGDGTYWNINTAGIFKTSYGANRTVVYNRHTTDNQSAETDEASLSGEQSGTTPSTRMNTPTQSDKYLSIGKDSEVSDTKQGKTEKVAENQSPNAVQAEVAAAEAATNTEPTEAQKEAGNYKKGHVRVGTLDITIENPRGSVRRGTDSDGKAWESKMHNTYGYIRGTEGVDGDHIDVFISNDIDGWNGRKVFVVDQYNPDGSFDEHKVMLGFNGMDEARGDYLANYEEGWEDGRRIDVSASNVEDFERWIGSSKRKTKPFGEYSSVVRREDNLSQAVELTGEKKGLQDKVIGWLTDENIEWAEGKDLNELIEHFGNNLEPIAVMPTIVRNNVPSLDGDYLYCGKAYMIDHHANHHPELDISEYTNIQTILDSYDDIKDLSDGGVLKIAFVKKLDKGYAVVAELSKENNKIVLHKTFFYRDAAGKRVPYRNKPSILERWSEDGSTPISPADAQQPADTDNISALDQSSDGKDNKFSKAVQGNLPEFDKENLSELKDFAIKTDSARRTSVDEAGFDAENLTVPLLVDGKPSRLAVTTIVPDAVTDSSRQAAVYDYSDGIDEKTDSGWQKWDDLADEYNGQVSGEARAAVYGDSAELHFGTVDAALRFNEWLRSGRIERQRSADKLRNGYTITPITYTNKRGKTTPMRVVRFSEELTKEQIKAGKELVKEPLPGSRSSRGWWDAKQGGFMMRGEEAARELAEALGSDEAVRDAQPLSLEDLAAVNGHAAAKAADEAIKAEREPQTAPRYDYGREDEVYGKTLTGLREALNNGGGIPDIKSIEKQIRDLHKRIKTLENGLATAGEDTIGRAYDALASLTGRMKAYEQFLSDIRKKMRETERDDALAAHGVKLGDKIMYKGKEATIYDADARQVTLDIGLSPVLYEVTDWEDIALPKQVKESAPKPKKVNVESLIGELNEKGEAKLSDHAEEVKDEPKQEETAEEPKQEEKRAKSKWVDDEDAARFEELRQRLREKLGGRLNMGIDPEAFAIGVEMSYLVLKHGARKFGEFARRMTEALGDNARPYLKAFYNGARDLPEMAGYEKELTPYGEVRAFDVMNFDKRGAKDIIATAEHISREQAAGREAREAARKLKEERNANRTIAGKSFRPATEEDIEKSGVVYYGGKPAHIMMVIQRGEQTGAGQFSKPRIDRVYLTNGKECKLEDLTVEDAAETKKSETAKKSEKTVKKSERNKKTLSLEKEQLSLFDEDINPHQEEDNGLRRDDVDVRTQRMRTDGNRERGSRGSQRDSEEIPQEGGRVDRRGESGSRETGQGISQRDERPIGRLQRIDEPKNTHNNHAARGIDYAPKSTNARIEANIKAIETMQRLIESGQPATPGDMAVLRKFSGWGGLGEAFREKAGRGDKGYNPRLRDDYQPANPVNARLRGLLSPEAYEAANMSRNSAYYTPASVIDAMWDVARAMGFRGGNVLEGSAGIGNILGLMPTDISERSDIHAVEIDETTGNILSLLYPDANVEMKGFEKTFVPNGSVDLAITNVPFVTGLRVMDETGDKDLSRKFHDIHDFCIAKNVRKLKEGGIGIFISSSGTLDSANSAKLRTWLVNDGGADVVGAFRMHNQTFGGTGATSDIIVIRKRVNGRKSANAIDVSGTLPIRTVKYNTGETKRGSSEIIIKDLALDINKHFVEHPEDMAGEMAFAFEKGDTYRATSKGLYPSKSINQEQRLSEWAQQFKDMDWDKAEEAKTQQVVYEDLGEDVKEGSMLLDSDGNLCLAQRGKAVPLGVNNNKVKGHTKAACFNDYKAIKDALADVLSYQTTHSDDVGLKQKLDVLNKVYDEFVKTYGHLNKNTSISFLRNDIDYPSIAALESESVTGDKNGERIVNYDKTDVFSRRVVEKESEPKPTTIKDGILASLYLSGRVDVPYIAKQLGKKESEVREQIIKSGLGFENPTTTEMEISYEYLSGNVREKLRQAQENNTDGRYDTNIKALERVIPMNIPAHLIEFTLGSSWVAPKLYEDFVKERTGIEVKLTNAGGTWVMNEPWYTNTEQNRAMGVYSEKCAKRILGHELIKAAITCKSISVSKTQTIGHGRGKATETIVDKEATVACANKIDEIRQDFKEWARGKMLGDPEMSERMERVYNEMFNNSVPKEIPDEFVPAHFGGAATIVEGHPFQLYPHQAKAVVRATTQPLMLAHEVGTGKTYTLISTAMEMRRLGTARKPMIVVQNATVGQFVASAKALYPNAKILTLEDADRNAEGRRNFYAKIRYNDWDMIVVPQSVFERIPDSEERQIRFVEDKVEEKMTVLEKMREAAADDRDPAVRQAERELARLDDELNGLKLALQERKSGGKADKDGKREAKTRQNAMVKAQEMLDRETDDACNFDDMGVDALLIDEAHEYKHLGFATAMQRGVKGVDPSYSKKSQGVYLKTQAVLENKNGKNVVFATGTPISNTAAEIWTFMRYLMPADTMREYGIYYFDDFVRNFGNIQQMLEFSTSGKYKESNRFAGYVNLPELVRIWSGVADTVLTREAGGVSDKIPEMEGGKARDIYLPQTKALRGVMKFVKDQLDDYEMMSGKEKKENSHIPLVMYGIAKAAAVDARLVLEDAADEPNSKTNEAVRQTLRSLEDTKDYNGTVAIFADNYQNKSTGFNLYEDIRKKLIDAGVPEAQVVVMKSGMSIKKKVEIFDKVNRGEVRVIMGSTFTLGTGVNIQERLHTLIHVDAPNRPMDYTQRNGRILRQGNLHKEWGIPVRVLRFGVEDSLDVTAYQRLKTKGAIADSIMEGKRLMGNSMENRVLEEEQDLFGDITAQLSGSQYALLKNQVEKEVRKLEARKKQHEADQTYVHNQKPRLKALIRDSEERAARNKEALEKVEAAKMDGITIGKARYPSLDAMADYIKDYNSRQREQQEQVRTAPGYKAEVKSDLTVNAGGFDFHIHRVISKEQRQEKGQLSLSFYSKTQMTYSCPELGLEDVPVEGQRLKSALEDILENVLSGDDFREKAEYADRAAERYKGELQQVEARDGKPFEYAGELKQAKERLAEYEELMKAEMAEKEAKYAEMDASVEAAKGVQLSEEDSDDVTEDTAKYRIREDEPPTKTGIGYKVFVLKDGKLYPPMVANPNGEATPVGVWLDADAAPIAGVTKTGRQQVKAGGKGTQGGSGKLAYRPGWHLGEIPYALQFNRMNPETGQRELFPANFVWAEVEYANDVDYQDEAMSYGMNANGKFKHSLAGLPRLPENGSYRYRTNPDPSTDPWVITGAMRVKRILKPSEVDAMVEAAGREPQQRQAGAITDEQVEALNAKVKRTMQEDRDMMRATVQQMGEKLHTDINIIEDVNEITHPNAAVQERRRKSKGWYDTKTGQVNIVLANNRDVDDVKASVGHETIAHKGLRELVGEENYDQFLDETYTHLRDDLKKGVDAAAGRAFVDDATKNGKRAKSYGHHRRTAVDELFGRMAEKPFEEFSGGERALWRKIKAAVRRLLDKFLGTLKLPKWFELGDNELRYMLWRSKERLERGREDYVDMARDAARREELGLADEARYSMGDAPETFKARQKRAVENKGTVMPGLNDAQVKIADVPKHTFTGTGRDAINKARSWANENLVGTHAAHQTGNEFEYRIDEYAVKKFLSSSSTTNSENLGVHLAVLTKLPDVIDNSIEAEEHPDYKKVNGERKNENGVDDANLLVHRMYGAVQIDGKTYRVKTTMHEHNTRGNAPHDYRVTKIELIISGSPTSDALNSSTENVDNSTISVAKLLQNIEKAYDSGKKILDESKIADEDAALYRAPDETEDIWNDQSLGLQERITAAATRLANNHRDNKTLRDDAMRAIGGNLSDLRKAMSLQRRFDRDTVKRVADLARVLMSGGYLNGLSQQEVKRLLAAVKNSAGRDNIEGGVQKVMDIMVDNQLRNGEAALRGLEAIRGSKVDARGVEVQGQLDPAGVLMMKAMREAKEIVSGCGGREYDDDGNPTAWHNTIEDAHSGISSNDAAVAETAALELQGIELARLWFDNIVGSKMEEATLRRELKTARETTSERDRATGGYRQYIASVQEAIRQNKIERAEAYYDLVGRITGSLRGSIANAQAFKEAEKRRIRDIQHNANSDMEGRPCDEHYKPQFMDKLVNNSFVRFFFAPLATFEQMLRLLGNKSANGEGYLYNRFVRGWVDARQQEIRGVREKYAILDAKAAELFGGKVKTWGGLIRRAGKLPKGVVSFWNGGEMQERELTQGNLMYIYMVNKMLDGRMKLRKMGISEEDVAGIEAALDPRLVELADWLQGEFLVETRNEYNETHKRMFGASMAAIEDYFPLKILANARADKPEDLDSPDKGDGISTATGSIIRRRRNALALDITGADALHVILDHIAQMEHWNAYAEFNRDLNTLRTYRRFRNQVQNMTTIYGSGKELWKKLNDVCQMAAGSYRPPRAMLDEEATNFAKGVTAAKVSLRVFTALKQFLSIPAYIPEVRADHIIADIINPVGAWKWSMEHLPIFEERWRSRTSGDPRLLKSDMDWKMWRTRIMQLASRAGMSPNAFIDALTVSIGAHAMYKTRRGQYLRDGYSEEQAERRAIQDAEILYNQTQQSSEGAFTSTMQVDRSWLSVLFTVFRNASMAYQRQLHDALRNMRRNLTPGQRAKSVAFMKKQLVRDGIDEASAEKSAKRKFRRQLLKDTLRIGVFGYVMQWAWNLGAYLPYLLFGDDDDEKQKMWDDVMTHTAFGWSEGFTGGDVMSQAGNIALSGDGNPAYVSKDMPLTSDIMSALKKLGNGKRAEALNDMVNIIVQSGIGVNPQSITDAVLAIMDACGDDPALAHEAAICISRILQVPQSQIDKMYFDEVGLSGDEASKYTPAQLAERYARFKVKRGYFVTPWLWNDDKLISRAENGALKKVKERSAQLGDPKVNEAYQRYEEAYKGMDKRVKAATRDLKEGKTDYIGYAKAMNALQRDEAFDSYLVFKQADSGLDEIAKCYIGSKSPEEAALCQRALLDYKAAMGNVLNNVGTDKQAEAMRGLGAVMQNFSRQYATMQPNR